MSESLKEIFDQWSQQAGQKYAQSQLQLSKWEVCEGVEWSDDKVNLLKENLKSRLKLKSSDSFIELGCAGGWLSEMISDEVSECYGLDFSLGMLKVAKEIYGQGKTLNADIGMLPLKDNSLDKILSYYVFLNFADDNFVEKGLFEVYRILKPNGIAVVGQLPDENASSKYEAARNDYVAYCEDNYSVGLSNRESFKPPLRLFNIEHLMSFFAKHNIQAEIIPSFNAFFRDGQPEVADWRFDIVITK